MAGLGCTSRPAPGMGMEMLVGCTANPADKAVADSCIVDMVVVDTIVVGSRNVVEAGAGTAEAAGGCLTSHAMAVDHRLSAHLVDSRFYLLLCLDLFLAPSPDLVDCLEIPLDPHLCSAPLHF